MNYKIETQNNINYYFDHINQDDIDDFVDILIQYKNQNIIFLGIGKSYNIASHFSDILKCINYSSLILEPAKLLHGDIGFIHSDDLIVMISNSGNTIELLNIIEVISKKKTQNIILLSSKKNSRLSGFCKKNYIVPVQQELKTCFKLIPSNSVVNYIIFANNILGSLINKLDLNETIYKTNHHSGNIGEMYKTVQDKLLPINRCCILKSDVTIKDAIIRLNILKIACAVIIDNDKVVGIITDRDIRTYLEKYDSLFIQIDKIMNKDFYFIDNLNMYIKDIDKKFNHIPIIINEKFKGLLRLI